MTKTLNEELENENARLLGEFLYARFVRLSCAYKVCVCARASFLIRLLIILFYFPAVIRELREEIQALQGYLDTANDQIQVQTLPLGHMKRSLQLWTSLSHKLKKKLP